MGLSFAVLLSIVMKKRRKPRLQEFRDRLIKKNSKSLTLYQYPSKTLFCIVGLLIIAICLEWFIIELRSDLLSLQHSSITMEKTISEEVDSFGPSEVIYDEGVQEYKQLNAENSQAIGKLRKTINIIHLCEMAGLIALIFSLQLRIVRTNKRAKSIEATNYLRLGLKRVKVQYQLHEGDKIQIWEMGETRFTNTNYYYSIRVVNQTHSWEIIKKSNIYSARTATIQLGFLHTIPYTTNIINMTNSQALQHQ